MCSYHTSPFIYEKSQAIYKIVEHTSLENFHQMMGINPMKHNTYEKITQRTKGKYPTYVIDRNGKNPNICEIRKDEKRMERKYHYM